MKNLRVQFTMKANGFYSMEMSFTVFDNHLWKTAQAEVQLNMNRSRVLVPAP